MTESIWKAFRAKYRELEESCYRASVASRAPQGRLRGRYRLPAPLMKKLSLDQKLEEIYENFFGPRQ